MARMDELYNDIYTYCEENDYWEALFTITEWNEELKNNYGTPSYTALFHMGKLSREKRYGERAFSYRLVPTGKVKERIDEKKAQRERERAEYIIRHYDEQLALRKARYEERIKEAEEQYQCDLEWEAEKLAKAKELLDIKD